MARDYASQQKPRKNRQTGRKKRKQVGKSSVSGWVWLTAGVLIGLFAAGLFYLHNHHLKQLSAEHKRQKAELAKNRQQERLVASRQQLKKQHFDFYTLLPKMRVWVPEQQPIPTNPAPSKPESKNTATQPGKLYVLQIASFERYADADRMRAQLLLLGFNAHIQKVTHRGKTYERVLVGPYTALQKAHQAQRRLAEQKMKSLLLSSQAKP